MFNETLLDSSPSRQPVLRGRHWLITTLVGVAGFLLGYFALPLIETPELRVLITQSVVLGVLLFCYALMVVYVFSDTRHLGLSTGLWVAVTFLLNVVGFVVYLIYTAAKTNEWKRATLPIAYMIEVVVIGVMVIVPLIYTEALPKAQLMTFLVAPPPPPPPPPPPAAAPVVIHKARMADLMKAPTVIPKTIAKIKEQPQVATTGVVGGVAGGVPGGQMGGVLGGIIGGVTGGPPPPPPPPKPKVPQRIRVGGQVEAAKLIFGPKPDYPPLAKMARIQGTVRLEALIAKDGTIKDLKVMSGHPLLVKAALAAVQQWRYQPTLLNGQPVEVQTEVDVNFTLSG